MGKKRLWIGGLFVCVMAAACLAAGRLTDGNVTISEQSPGCLSGLKVCLDPGHGGYDGGAVGRESGRTEKELNLLLARQIKAALEKEGAQVTLTRTRDEALAEAGDMRKRRDLQARVKTAQGADVFLSLHMNEYPDRTQSGPQVFYTSGQESSRLLAGAIQQSMNAQLSPARPRSALPGDYFVLRTQPMPAVLIECGFLSNAEEEKKLLTESYREQIARSLLSGLIEFVHLQGNLANET